MSSKDFTAAHDEDCFKGWVIAANLVNQKVGTVPSFRGVWSCQGCVPSRYAKKVAHLPPMIEELCVVVETRTRAGSTQRRATRKNYGYMRVTLGDGMYVSVGEPELFPDIDPMPTTKALEYVLDLILHNGVTRISFNAKWKPENIAKYYTFPTYEKDKAVVNEALQEIGYREGDRVRGSLEAFQRDLLEKLGHSENVEGSWSPSANKT